MYITLRNTLQYVITQYITIMSSSYCLWYVLTNFVSYFQGSFKRFLNGIIELEEVNVLQGFENSLDRL